MKRTLLLLDSLQNLINSEKESYKQAIKNNQKLEEVKVIYLKIKKLENMSDEMMQQAHSKLQYKAARP